MSASKLPTMAWRNLWRNRRRTLLTLASFSFGVLLAVLFTGMGDDSYSKMIALAARLGSGHVTIQHPEFHDTPSLKKTVEDVAGLSRQASEQDHVVDVVGRISGPAMLATAGKSYGAFFIAIDPTAETVDTLSILDSIAEGAMFETADDQGIILGATLAENLGAKLGRKVVYTMTDKSGEIISGLGRVTGIVKTSSPSIDGGMCLLPIGTVRKALGYASDEAISVAVFIDDQRKARDVAAALDAVIPETATVLSWQEAQPELAGFISVDRASTVVLEIIIMILISAGIFNSLFVSVMERIREFGIMLAIGFTSTRLFGLVMWESLWLALVGLFASALVTIGPYYYFHTTGIDFTEYVGEGYEVSGVAMDPIIFVNVYPEHLLYIAGAVVIATLVAGLYPAWKAGRIVPVETIRLV